MPKESGIKREWLIIDAKGKTLGRLASRIARVLQGKHKPIYAPHLLCGDKVIIVNAKYIRVSGKKMKDKIYDKYTGYPSGRKEISLQDLMQKNPTKALELAVKGMLPKNKLRKKMLLSLKIYPELEHKHIAQKPREAELP